METGKPLSRGVVFLLKRLIPGISSDWLYFGETDGLSLAWARRLGEIPARKVEPPLRKGELPRGDEDDE